MADRLLNRAFPTSRGASGFTAASSSLDAISLNARPVHSTSLPESSSLRIRTQLLVSLLIGHQRWERFDAVPASTTATRERSRSVQAILLQSSSAACFAPHPRLQILRIHEHQLCYLDLEFFVSMPKSYILMRISTCLLGNATKFCHKLSLYIASSSLNPEIPYPSAIKWISIHFILVHLNISAYAAPHFHGYLIQLMYLMIMDLPLVGIDEMKRYKNEDERSVHIWASGRKAKSFVFLGVIVLSWSWSWPVWIPILFWTWTLSTCYTQNARPIPASKLYVWLAISYSTDVGEYQSICAYVKSRILKVRTLRQTTHLHT